MAQTGPVSVPEVAPPLAGPVVFDQQWLDLTFLHWPVRPADIERFLPPGTRPDLFEGRTYVGLVPFRMRHAGLGRRLAMPWLGSFLEVNVRLYSVDDAGRHGVVFRTLDATRLPIVAVARWALRVPYVYSAVRAAPFPPTPRGRPIPLPAERHRRYEVRRRLPGPGAHSRVGVVVGEPVDPTPLEVFLTARWGMHSRVAGRGVWVPNEHGSWPLHTAELVELDDTLVAAAGVTPAGPMLRPLWSPGVRARFGPPVRLPRP